ncbi:ankyrin repeat domain-containing protein [Streptomyces sp. DH-12]|uniref:ankyrin repeat domain-containing protein n=1 Tax=Streptomyces sp. DH-12 TaxID=2072509 RepID=UPI000CCE71B7|nr:ankyrin repeat domain-containing protein [Streptomyces sp. DH-12]PNV32331.1 ankyrin repeat domain-containing protein [Streptomyces sp. DH-12]
MSRRTAPACFSPEEASSWRRIRRHAVPRGMIERATQRRTAGDWRGACAAALVDVDLDLAEIAEHCGHDVADALEDDLRHLVPDLVRWHLPRYLGGWTTLATDRTVVLARYRPVRAGEEPRSTPYLHLTTPAMRQGPQRITLRFGTLADEGAAGVFSSTTEDWRYARHLWDDRHTAVLREHAGGPGRLPFFSADGGLLAPDELPPSDPGAGDPAARAEWVTLLHEKGEAAEAFAAAGIDADLTTPGAGPRWYRSDPTVLVGRLALDHTRLEREVRRLRGEGVGDRFLILGDWRTRLLLEPAATGLALRAVDREEVQGLPFLPETLWRRLPDLDLLRVGGVAPEHLHPLVGEALFPGVRPDGGIGGPPGPGAPAPVRVRCRGEWHEVGFRPDGRLRMPHSDEEQQREWALRAFGGAVAGCFAVAQTWTSGEGRLPKALRAQRLDFFLRAQHGDTDGVLRLLDAGMDIRVRSAAGRSLLHVLNLIDHERLLPRLLAAGLDLEARDKQGRTPLFVAVAEGGSRALVEALLDAGARIDVEDGMELSLAHVVRRYRRSDLAFLRKRVREEHPDVGSEWWEDYLTHLQDEDNDPEPDEDGGAEPVTPEPDGSVERETTEYSEEPPF